MKFRAATRKWMTQRRHVPFRVAIDNAGIGHLTPRRFADGRKLILGRAGDITHEHCVEKFGREHFRRLVEELWVQVVTRPWPRS
jgi:hypothetical protein